MKNNCAWSLTIDNPQSTIQSHSTQRNPAPCSVNTCSSAMVCPIPSSPTLLTKHRCAHTCAIPWDGRTICRCRATAARRSYERAHLSRLHHVSNHVSQHGRDAMGNVLQWPFPEVGDAGRIASHDPRGTVPMTTRERLARIAVCLIPSALLVIAVYQF